MHTDTASYNAALEPGDREVCDLLAQEIQRHLRRRTTRSGTGIRCGFWTAIRWSVTAS